MSAEDGASGLPEILALSAGHPNPFRAEAEFALSLPEAAHVTARVYDVMGRAVAVLADGPRAAGASWLRLDGRDLASGVYVVRVVAGGSVATQRITLVR